MSRRHVAVKALVIFGLLILNSVWTSTADESALYIQYYSQALGGFVIERADGSDSRLFALDEPYDSYRSVSVTRPGWSPSGEWFAWRGYAQKVDGSGLFSAVETYAPHITRVVRMEWGPGPRNLLFIIGSQTAPDCKCGDQITFVLRDMDAGQDIATWRMSSDQQAGSMIFAPTRWSSEGGGRVSISVLVEETRDRTEALNVRLGFDGATSHQPLTHCCRQGGMNPDVIRFGTPFDSPSGRYHVLLDYYTRLLDRTTGVMRSFPAFSNARIPTQYLNFNRAETWMLVMQSSFITGDYEGPDLLGVMNLSGTYWRELSICRYECGMWLPEQVDTSRLSPGSPDSVLLAPTSTVFFKKEIDNWKHPNYQIACDDTFPDGRRLFPAKGEGSTYYLDYRQACPLPLDIVYDAIVALSPDGQILALADHDGRAVSVWSTHAGDLLTRLNTFGYALSFSADGQQLYTLTSQATHTWHVSDIWRRYGYRAALD